MVALVLPCAGSSSRYPNLPPKWMLTHPSGLIMLKQGLTSFPVSHFSKVVPVITRKQVDKFQADLVLKKSFGDYPGLELVVLEEQTNGPFETISKAIEIASIEGPLVIKDSDNFVSTDNEVLLSGQNFVVGCSLRKFSVSQPQNKSYILANEQGFIVNVVEKEIASNTFCAGVYGISDASEFYEAGVRLLEIAKPLGQELFVSHVISNKILERDHAFFIVDALGFEDWGTETEWRNVQRRHNSIFVEFDGVIARKTELFDPSLGLENVELIEENIQRLAELAERGAQIIVITSRPESMATSIEGILRARGLDIHKILADLNESPRLVLNGFGRDLTFPSCNSLSIPQNTPIVDFV